MSGTRKSSAVESCPQPETPIRERAWTAEQVERAAEQLCVRSRDDLDAERMLRAYAATLRQPTNPPEIGSKLVGQQGEQDGGVVSAEAVSVFRDAYIEAYDNAASVSYAPVDNGCIEIALEAVAPLLHTERARVPVGVMRKAVAWETLGADGEWCRITQREFDVLQSAGIGQQRKLCLHEDSTHE